MSISLTVEPPAKHPYDVLRANLRRMHEVIQETEEAHTALGQTAAKDAEQPMSRRKRRRLKRQRMLLAQPVEPPAREESRKASGWILPLILGVIALAMFAQGSPATIAIGLALLAVAFRKLTTRGSASSTNPSTTHGRLNDSHLREAVHRFFYGRIGSADPVAKSEPQHHAEAIDKSEPQHRAEATMAAPTAPPEARDRTDALCDKLVLELRASPPAVRGFLHHPEETIASLRQAYRSLHERERLVRGLLKPEEAQRLETERASLIERAKSEPDHVVQERLTETVKFIDEELRQRANLATAAARLEAERTRIHYALENLYLELQSLRSADAASADVAGAGLRQSLARLGDEVSAVTTSLEAVSRGDESPMTPVGPVTSTEADVSPGDRAPEGIGKTG